MPQPTKQDAYEVAEKLKQEGIIIFSFKGSTVGFASFGITEALANSLKVIVSKTYQIMMGKKPNS